MKATDTVVVWVPANHMPDLFADDDVKLWWGMMCFNWRVQPAMVVIVWHVPTDMTAGGGYADFDRVYLPHHASEERALDVVGQIKGELAVRGRTICGMMVAKCDPGSLPVICMAHISGKRPLPNMPTADAAVLLMVTQLAAADEQIIALHGSVYPEGGSNSVEANHGEKQTDDHGGGYQRDAGRAETDVPAGDAAPDEPAAS